MNTPASAEDVLRQAFASPERGILGLVDSLLSVARQRPLQLRWKADRCQIELDGDGMTPTAFAIPFRKSAVRAILARVSVLCDETEANSVSPYGGQGTLLALGVPLRVSFINTPDEQSLVLGSAVRPREGVQATPTVDVLSTKAASASRTPAENPATPSGGRAVNPP